MANQNKLSLSVLDKYAKMLTSSQVHKLYEHKLGSPYKKMLLEEQNIENKYKVFVSYDILSQTGLDKYDFNNFMVEGVPGEGYDHLPDVSFNMDNHQGIWVSCKYPTSFREVLTRISELKISDEVEDTVMPHQFVQYLYPANI